MSTELEKFVAWLQSDLPHFVALVEEGSAVTGDPWQEGLSDHDLQIVVATDKQAALEAVSGYLQQHPLGNEYLAGVRLQSDYIVGDTLNDLSLKFRSKTIAGEDVVAQKANPDRETAMQIGSDGLTQLTVRLERRWLNLTHWTTEYAQKKNYEIFKNFFVFYSALQYGQTGHYPLTRTEAAALIPDQPAAQRILAVTNDSAHASKAQQKAAIEAAIKLVHDINSLGRRA